MFVRRLVGVAALGLMSTGCISQEKYKAQQLRADGLEQQLSKAETDAIAARTQAASWKAQLDQVMAGSSGQAGLTDNLYKQNATLTAQLADITAKYNEALARIGQGQPLPAALTNELTTFADQNPDLVEFDAASGTVKFKSDLTFNSGDAQLQPAAQTAIARFATILNSAAAANYELLIAGHADNQKVSAATAARGHKDNWHLSAHRALSVAEALQKQNVAPKRIGAVGYGEYRPVASNDSRQGMASNRRVEVLILPTTVGSATPAAAPAEPASAAPSVNQKEDQALNK